MANKVFKLEIGNEVLEKLQKNPVSNEMLGRALNLLTRLAFIEGIRESQELSE